MRCPQSGRSCLKLRMVGSDLSFRFEPRLAGSMISNFLPFHETLGAAYRCAVLAAMMLCWDT